MGRPRKPEARHPHRAERAEQQGGRQASELPADSRWRVWLTALALFLVVAGARWWLIGKYSADVPWLDQWDAEAQGLYQPWHSGTLTIHSWFTPHNEHRIFFTRLLALALLWWNRQWDPRLQMVVNAGIFALISAGLFLALRKGREARFQAFCWVLLAALGSAPYSATNILLGFQSQFYFLAGFSLLAIYGLLNGRPGSPLWIAGALGGCAALVSMASGHAAALAVLAALLVSALRSAKEYRQELRQRRTTILAASILVAAGFCLRYSPPQHAALAAKSAADFARFLVACLSWPGKPMVLLAAFSWLPFAAFLANYLRRSTRDDPVERLVLGIGSWVLLQAAALSLFRANSEEGLESRYTDILAFGLLANAICVIWLLDGQGHLRKLAPFFAVAWLVVSGAGLYAASFDGSAFGWKQSMEIRRAAAAGFIATGNPQYLDNAPPYPDPKRAAALLLDPALHPILPAGIREPLALTPRSGSPPPAYINAWSAPDARNITPDVWTLAGIFSRFAVIPPAARFEYQVEKKSRLPFLLLYFIGDPAEISAADSAHAAHRIIPLPSSGDGQSHHAVVYCPAQDCVLRGSSGPSQLALMEPKEIGGLSIAALFAALWAPLVLATGLALFLTTAIVPRR